MKSLLLIPILSLPLLLSGCEAVIVDRPVRRSAYVERDVYYGDSRDRRDDRYDRRDDRRDRRDVVIVAPKPAYRQPATVRYYNDNRGRYHIKEGRRIYVNTSVRY